MPGFKSNGSAGSFIPINLAYINAQQRKEILTKGSSRIGVISSLFPGQYYDVTLMDDSRVISRVSNSILGFKWKTGQFVTIEWNGIDWSIVGSAPFIGGTS